MLRGQMMWRRDVEGLVVWGQTPKSAYNPRETPTSLGDVTLSALDYVF